MRDSRLFRAIGALGAGAMLGLASGSASGQSVVIDFEGNSVGGLHGQAGPGSNWFWLRPTERLDLQVASDRVSPIGGGSRALKHPAGLGATRMTVDLGVNFDANSGVVKVQFDFWTSTLFAQGAFRFMPMNTDVTGDGTANEDFNTQVLGQVYTAGAGGQYGCGGWLSYNGAGPSFNDNLITRNAAAGACEGKWYRAAYYFDFGQTGQPMVYMELFDIDTGSATRIGERRQGDGVVALNINPALREIRSLALRVPGTQNEDFYFDNITVASVPGFTPPAQQIALNDPGDPAPGVRPPQASDVVAQASVEVNLDLSLPIGAMPSMALVEGTLYMLDGGFGLQSWDTVTRPGSPTFVDGANVIDFASEPSSIMIRSGEGSALYVWANTLGLGSGTVWRDLAAWHISAGMWSLLVDGDPITNTGDHGIARAEVDGNELVYSAWMGATQYTGFNVSAGTSAVSIQGVGNRWAGAVTEGRSPTERFMPANTDAAGNRLNLLVGQVYQGLYRTTWIPGCVNPSAVLRRISPSAQVVPWVLACGDGGCVNRASLEYVPQTNSIWLLRAAGTEDIGVYDIDTDTWQVVKVEAPTDVPLTMTHADIQLVGTRMYIFNEGSLDLVSVDAFVSGCAADYDGDGFVTGDDFTLYVTAFENGDPEADYDNDGFITGDDFTLYVTLFETGC